MLGNSIDWEIFRNLIINVGMPIYSVREDDKFVELITTIHGAPFSCILFKANGEVEHEDYTDYKANFQHKVNTNGGYDHAGRQVHRQAATFTGWSYLGMGFDYVTSSGELVVENAFGGDLSDEFLIKRYNSADELTEVSADVVREEIVWKPDYDYDMISGMFFQAQLAPSDLRIWVYGGAHESGAAGNVEFARNINASLILSARTDGRASKHVRKETEGVPFQTNQLTYKLKHEAGLSHKIGFVVDLYRE